MVMLARISHAKANYHLVEEGRIFGDTVHVARRIASLAKPLQILISRESNDRIPPQAQIATRFGSR